MNFLADRQFWGDIANNTRQAAGGLLSATLGAPVDIATMVMRPFGYKVDDKKVVGSSEHIAGLLGLDTESIPYKVASLMPTDATDLMKYGGLLGTFAGVNAKTANKALLEAAQKMDKSGVDRAKIWQDTGWFKGPEGKWRFEIDDSAAKLKFDALPEGKSVYQLADAKLGEMPAYQTISPGLRIGNPKIKSQDQEWALKWAQSNPVEAQAIPLQQALSHPSLLDAYPSLNDLKIGRAEGVVQGSFDANNKTIRTGGGVLGASSPKSTALHELQHAVQQTEGFAKGGSTAEFPSRDAIFDAQVVESLIGRGMSPSDAAQYMRTKLQMSPDIDAMDLAVSGKAFKTLDPYEQYRRLAGEAEARAVQSRMNLSPAERRAKAPWESYDVPWEQLIVRGQDSGGLLSASAPKPKYGAVAPGLMGSVKSVKGGLLSDGMKKAKPLTEAQFNRAYMAHKDLRGVREGTLEQNLKSIAESGFRRGFNVNLLPPYAGGAPTSIVDRAYAPKAGDVMYLIPQEGRVRAGNGFVTKEGYKPAPHEVLRITEDFPSLYQEYLKAWAATNKP